MLIRKERALPDITAQMSLRVPAELKDDIDTLAYSAKTTTSELVVKLIQELVDANRARIDQFNKLCDEVQINWWASPEDETGNTNG